MLKCILRHSGDIRPRLKTLQQLDERTSPERSNSASAFDRVELFADKSCCGKLQTTNTECDHRIDDHGCVLIV